ncbi:metallophosphoesterase family protein [Methanobacterium spitsbergense]|uniref:Metallophosphoesterase n=1 Tax=Methanobacterium spitsbergense TaxID=2874285 RepID=A0A8T5UV94_9EURY|nr:metallophosphoesterase [Methanobacterium spitsbergense]MBZ2166147.1 metallophosphoesterase [Methanobacterium spitsbergense]
MKILAVSDIHGKYIKIIDYLKKNTVDLIILTGDITDFGPNELAEEILNEISSFNIPVLAIPGNCDPINLYGSIDNSKAVNIHGKSVTIKNIGICGFGGSNPTPFNTPLEFDEIEIYDNARRVMEEIKNHEVTLFVTHAPPLGTKTDLLPSGKHVGSESLRKIIEEFQPSINICGHIHESIAIDKIGKTTIINPGMLKEGHACIINIDDSDEDNIKAIPEIISI